MEIIGNTIDQFFWYLFSRTWTKYGEILRIQFKCGKTRTRKTLNTDTFQCKGLDKHLRGALVRIPISMF